LRTIGVGTDIVLISRFNRREAQQIKLLLILIR
jgi:phosphopantetheinyl transferase (holo-ACP synthase)